MPPKTQAPPREMFYTSPQTVIADGEIRVVLPYPPSANRYWRSARNRVFVSAEAKAYKQEVAAEVKRAVRNPFRGPVIVEINIYRPAQRGDLDNRTKVLLDALNGIAYNDDKQVVEIHSYRHDDKHDPRAEVTIKALEVQS